MIVVKLFRHRMTKITHFLIYNLLKIYRHKSVTTIQTYIFMEMLTSITFTPLQQIYFQKKMCIKGQFNSVI